MNITACIAVPTSFIEMIYNYILKLFFTFKNVQRLSKAYHKRKTYEKKQVEYTIIISGNGRHNIFGKRIYYEDIV